MPGTPANIAAGRKNMLATTWSKPMATNAMIGKKIARILPETDVAASDIQTARHTSQLHPTPRRKVCQPASCSLPWAMAASRSWVSAAAPDAPEDPTTPVWTARKYATTSAPTRLPSRTRVRFRATSPPVILPRIALSGTSIMLPVARSEPAMSTRTSPRVNAAPVKSVGRVPQVPGSRPDETAIATSPPKAMYAPARNELTSTRSHVRWTFLAPTSVATCAISCGSRAVTAPSPVRLCVAGGSTQPAPGSPGAEQTGQCPEVGQVEVRAQVLRQVRERPRVPDAGVDGDGERAALVRH